MESVIPHPALAAELDLRARFVSGDRRAFEELVRPHLNLLYTLCLRMLNDAVQAEDAAQETLIRALSRRNRYNPERPFRPWLLAIATNLCRDRMRTVWWRRVVSLVRDERPDEALPDTLLAGSESDRRVRAALATLPDIYREALSLYHLEDLSYAEISEITGVQVGALKQRVRRGGGLLRDAMVRMYPEMAAVRTDP